MAQINTSGSGVNNKNNSDNPEIHCLFLQGKPANAFFAEMVGLLGVRSKSVINFWIDKLIEAEILEKDEGMRSACKYSMSDRSPGTHTKKQFGQLSDTILNLFPIMRPKQYGYGQTEVSIGTVTTKGIGRAPSVTTISRTTCSVSLCLQRLAVGQTPGYVNTLIADCDRKGPSPTKLVLHLAGPPPRRFESAKKPP